MDSELMDGQSGTSELNEQKANELRQQLRQDPEVVQLAKKIDVKNQMEILEFGTEPAQEISKFADRILNSMKTNRVEDSGELLKQLGRIMDKFDKKDFENEKPGFFQKVFKRSGDLIEKIFNKYQTMGGEIDKVYIEIKKYQEEMKNSVVMLDQMYGQNYEYYLQLEKYVVAGQEKVEELKTTMLPQLEQQVASGNQLAAMELDTLKTALEMMEQRIYDLEMARMVSLQTAPQIRLLQRGNNKLIAKINSAFVTTIPIFKNGIIQAISAKRQKLVADSMAELDRRTNEMLTKNAQNIATQSTEIARLTGSSSIKIETIEESWKIIAKGMEDTKAIEDENKRSREEGMKRMAELTQDIKRQLQR